MNIARGNVSAITATGHATEALITFTDGTTATAPVIAWAIATHHIEDGEAETVVVPVVLYGGRAWTDGDLYAEYGYGTEICVQSAGQQ